MTTTAEPLKSPFPWPGGKARVADLVWSRLGDVDNFVEPFAGSLAVLLRRPAEHFANGYRVETVNDLNHYVVNFWRAVAKYPKRVAQYADRPVTEADLHAAHRWLMRSTQAGLFRDRMLADPFYCDPKVAGLWAWGMCCWIGSGWCADNWNAAGDSSHKIKMPDSDGGRGLLDTTMGRPQLADAFDIGRGVNAGGGLSNQIIDMDGGRGLKQAPPAGELSQKRPAMKDPGSGNGSAGFLSSNWQAGTCSARRAWLTDWMQRLADRLRLVRTCYGHWSRICDSDSTLTRLGTTGVFLDPPYPTERGDTGKKSRAGSLYATDKGADLNKLRDEVLAWCVKWGGDAAIRIAVCGYEGDGYELLEAQHGWTCESWTASGGYGNQRKDKKGKADNAKRERIWFNASCTPPAATLFDSVQA